MSFNPANRKNSCADTVITDAPDDYIPLTVPKTNCVISCLTVSDEPEVGIIKLVDQSVLHVHSTFKETTTNLNLQTDVPAFEAGKEYQIVFTYFQFNSCEHLTRLAQHHFHPLS